MSRAMRHSSKDTAGEGPCWQVIDAMYPSDHYQGPAWLLPLGLGTVGLGMALLILGFRAAPAGGFGAMVTGYVLLLIGGLLVAYRWLDSDRRRRATLRDVFTADRIVWEYCENTVVRLHGCRLKGIGRAKKCTAQLSLTSSEADRLHGLISSLAPHLRERYLG